MEFACACRSERGRTVCAVDGELDIVTVGQLRRSAREAMDIHGADLTLDLSGLTFLSAAGITAVLRIRREAMERGGELRLGAVPEQVLRLLVVTGTAEALGATRRAASAVQPCPADH